MPSERIRMLTMKFHRTIYLTIIVCRVSGIFEPSLTKYGHFRKDFQSLSVKMIVFIM